MATPAKKHVVAPDSAHSAWVGCYVHDKDGDLTEGPQRHGYDTATCTKACNGYKFMALQNSGFCACGNPSPNSPQYKKVDDHECGNFCFGEAGLVPPRYCGGPDRDAVYIV